MDLIRLIYDANKLKNTCCLCLSSSSTNNSIFDVFEIVDESINFQISLLNMIKNILPQHEIFLYQACKLCTDLIIKLFIIIQKSNIKKHTLSTLLGKINNTINQSEHIKNNFIINLNEKTNVIVCNKCNMKFYANDDLIKHRKLAHTQTSNAKVCQVCGKDWPTSKKLKMHLNSHIYKECPYCLKLLKTHAHYYKHVKKHVGVTAPKMNNCDTSIDKNDCTKEELRNYKPPEDGSILHEKIPFTAHSKNKNKNNYVKEKISNQDTKCQSKVPEGCLILTEEDLTFSGQLNTINSGTCLNKNDCVEVILRNDDTQCLSQQRLSEDGTILPKEFHLSGQQNLISGDIQVNTYFGENYSISTERTMLDNNITYVTNSHSNYKFNNNIIHKDAFINKYNNKTQEYATKANKGKKYYPCDSCAYKSITKSNLEAHYNRIHLNIRPYACDICLKTFYRKSNLSEHILTHDNAKNFTCEICGSNFVSKKTLENHLRHHNDVRKIICNVCNKDFVNIKQLNEHVKRLHMRKVICCPFCHKRYGLSKDLKRHISRVDPIK